MATDKCLSDCTTRWATKLFLTKSCAEIITAEASCLAEEFNQSRIALVNKTGNEFKT